MPLEQDMANLKSRAERTAFDIRLTGSPQQCVIDASKAALAATLDHMKYSGALLPKLVIADGSVLCNGQLLAAGYTPADATIYISEELLPRLLSSGFVPVDGIAAWATAQEAAHFVQHQEGRIDVELLLPPVVTPNEVYLNQWHEVE